MKSFLHSPKAKAEAKKAVETGQTKAKSASTPSSKKKAMAKPFRKPTRPMPNGSGQTLWRCVGYWQAMTSMLRRCFFTFCSCGVIGKEVRTL